MNEIDYTIECWYSKGCPGLDEFPLYPRCKNICTKYKEMNYLINNCGMPNAERFLKVLTPSKADESAFKKLREIKDNIEDEINSCLNLYISSANKQTGKTTWSLKLLYKYFDRIWFGNGFRPRGYFIYVPEFLMNMKIPDYKGSEEFKTIDKNIKNLDIIIWDDLTTIKLSEYDQNVLNMYINKRLHLGKSNIFNGLAPKYYAEQVGESLKTTLNNCNIINLIGS